MSREERPSDLMKLWEMFNVRSLALQQKKDDQRPKREDEEDDQEPKNEADQEDPNNTEPRGCRWMSCVKPN